MSTLKATNLQHASATSPNITLGSDGSVAVGGGNISPQTGFRNRIINGGMVIDQRNNGAAVTRNATDTTYQLDRWATRAEASDGVFTVQQVTDAPTGFIKSLKITVTTADASIGATQIYALSQLIEGNNVADLGWGTANAQDVTFSFWVKSSLTGTFGGAVRNGSVNRGYAFTYTIASANTWEYKTVTIPGDTTGTWATDNTTGIAVGFSIGAGADRLVSAGSWQSSFVIGATGQTQVIATNGATFYITGVQLEKGSVATPFEFRSIGQELALCQRYYEQLESTYSAESAYGSGVNPRSYWWFKVQKRVTPTVTNAGIGAAGSIYVAAPQGVGLSNSLGGGTSFGRTANASAEL